MSTPESEQSVSDLIHAAIQEHAPEAVNGGVLVGFALVTEWMDPDGDRWLAKFISANLTSWAAKGYWHEALHGDWADDDDEDEPT